MRSSNLVWMAAFRAATTCIVLTVGCLGSELDGDAGGRGPEQAIDGGGLDSGLGEEVGGLSLQASGGGVHGTSGFIEAPEFGRAFEQPNQLRAGAAPTGATLPPVFRFDITTCPAGPLSPSPRPTDTLSFTLQTVNGAFGGGFNNEGDDRVPGATDRYVFNWSDTLAAGPGTLESIKFEFVGTRWCMQAAKLFWKKSASLDESAWQLFWAWDSLDSAHDDRPGGLYVHEGTLGSSTRRTGPIVLDDDAQTGQQPFVRFTDKTVQANWAVVICAQNRYWRLNTCNTTGSATDTSLAVEIKHDGLLDFFSIPKSSVDAPSDLFSLNKNAWCGLSKLESLRIYKRRGHPTWRVCDARYLDLTFPTPSAGVWTRHWSWPNTAQPTNNSPIELNDTAMDGVRNDRPYVTQDQALGYAILTYPVSAVVDGCTGTDCYTSHQGFPLHLEERTKECILGSNPPETCNGIDDDCDSQIDEEAAAGATSCLGQCRVQATCANGTVTCGAPTTEIPANGLDEDCDGADGCSEDRQCASGLSCIDGDCRAPHCDNGVWDESEAGLDCGGSECPQCDVSGCPGCQDGEPIAPRAQDSLRFNRGTFTRPGTATVSPAPGRVETARTNELRWIEVEGNRLALFEGVSSNVIRWSSAFNHAPEWTAAASAPMTITADAAIAPDGTQTAELLRSPTGPSRSPSQVMSLGAGSWNFSFHTQSMNGDLGDVNQTRVFALAPSNSVLSTTVLRTVEEWKRLDLRVAPSATTSISFGLSHVAGWPTAGTTELPALDFAIWGAQLELKPFPTSYIPATSATVTRSADLLTIPGSLVPGWLGGGTWQVDVSPEFSSGELIARPWQHTLFSYNANNEIALVASPNAGKTRLSVKYGSATFESPDLVFKRGAVLRLTFNMRAPAQGQADTRGVTISGADSGDGVYLIPNLAHPPMTTLRIGGKLNGSWEAFAAISEPRAVLHAEEACEADPACACADDGANSDEPACDPTQCQPDCSHAVCGSANDDGCGVACADVCPDLGPGCRFDFECSTGFTCGINEGISFNLPVGSSVCWPQLCDNPRERLRYCGDVTALCGKCPETPNECGERQCGTDRYGHPCGQCVPGQTCKESGKCGALILDSIPDHVRPHLTDPQVDGVGSLPGTFAVDESGAANYSIPIAVPPGRAGMTPQLALAYRSSSGHGYAGRGWSLTGLSGISRCPRTFAQDGFARAVQNTADDAFCLDGKRLVAMPDQSYGADGTEYRTELDSFSKVISYGAPVVAGKYYGPAYFIVWTKDGRILSYGVDSSARVTAKMDAPSLDPHQVRNVSNVNVSWMLQLVDDRSGNRMRVEYERDIVSDGYWAFPQAAANELNHVGEIRPTAIFYGADDSHVVRFSYLPTMVNTVVRSYRGGVAHHVSRPIEEISTSIQDSTGTREVRRYVLEPRFFKDGWLLDSVKTCIGRGASEICMPATGFTYREKEPLLAELPTDDEAAGGMKNTPVAAFAMDHDGDGAQDLIHQEELLEKRLFLRRSSGATSGGSVFDEVGEEVGSRCHRVLGVLDFNDDGRDDIIAICYTTADQLEYKREPRLLLSTGGDFSSRKLRELVDGDLPVDQHADDLFVADMNGDGRKDLVGTDDHDGETVIRIWKNAGASFAEVASHTIPNEAKCTVYDWDGDGGSEVLCQYDENRLRVLGFQSSGLVVRTDQNNSNGINLQQALKLDANGDGVLDLVFEKYVHEGDRVYYVPELFLGTGRGYDYVTRSPEMFGASDRRYRSPNVYNRVLLFVFDVDSDGRQEILEGDPVEGKWRVHRPYSFDHSASSAAWQSSFELDLPYVIPRFGGDSDDAPNWVNGFSSPVAVDLDGDGSKEAVVRVPGPDNGGRDFKHPRFQIWKPTPTTQGLLHTITDGFGKATTINYEVKPGDYRSSPTGCSFPQRCLKALPSPVVVDCTVSGKGGPYRNPNAPLERPIERLSFYSYSDARFDVRGRGWLGFAKRTIKEYADFSDGVISETSLDYDLRAHDDALSLYYRAGRAWQTSVKVITHEPSLSGTGDSEHLTVSSQVLDILKRGSSRPFLAPKSATTKSTVWSAAGSLSTQRDGTFDYDEFGNVEKETTTWSDGRHQSVTTTYAREATDGSSLVGKWLVGLPEDVTVDGKPHRDDFMLVRRGYKLHFAYDGRGLVRTVDKKSPYDDLEVSTQLRYEGEWGELGLVTSRTISPRDARARTDTITYDAYGIYPYLLSNTVYEEAGVPPSRVGYDVRTGQLRYSLAPDGSLSVWNHDAFGRLRSSSSAGMSTTVEYRGGGTAGGALRVKTSGPGQPTAETEYNAFGQVILQVSEHWKGEGIAPTKASMQEFGYDERGRLRAVAVPHEPGGAVVARTYDYDNLDRLTQETEFWHDEHGVPHAIPITHTYDHKPSRVQGTGGIPWSVLNHGVWAHAVESPGQPRSIDVTDQRGNTVATIDANGGLTKFEYGAFDDLENVSALGSVTIYGHDSFGRVTSVADDDTGRHGYTYNGLDLVRTYERNASTSIGHTTTYQYDFMGRLNSERAPDGVRVWEYDGNDGNLNDPTLIGHLVEESLLGSPHGSGHTRYVYGGPGGALTETHRTIDGETFDSHIEYDGLGRPEFVRYPVPGRLFTLQYKYQGTHGRLAEVADATDPSHPLWKLEDVDAFGNATKVRYGNGLITTREHELATGLLSQILVKSSPTFTIHNEKLYYDQRGLLSKRVRFSGDWVETYSHDALGRLKSRTKPTALGSGVETFGYSDDGNLTCRREGDPACEDGTQTPTQTLHYDDEARPHQLTRTDNGYNFNYDAHGRQDVRNPGSALATQRVVYTSFDLPGEVRLGAPGAELVTSYRYDASNKRVARVEPDGKRTVYVGDVFERATMRDGTLLEQRIRIPTPDGPVVEATIDDAGVNYLYHSTDNLGSPTAVTNEEGQAVALVSHHPFGAPEVFETNDPRVRPSFTGQEHDGTGLINMRGRMYDAAIGRFLTPDPFVPGPMNSQSWNRYSYVWNSPLHFTDPSGFYPVDEPYTSVETGETYWVDEVIEVHSTPLPNDYDPLAAMRELGVNNDATVLEPPVYLSTRRTPEEVIQKHHDLEEARLKRSRELEEDPPLPVNRNVDPTKCLPFTCETAERAWAGANLIDNIGEFLAQLLDNVGLDGQPGPGVATVGMIEVKAARRAVRIGPKWTARSITDAVCEVGCEKVAQQIQKQIGGNVVRITPASPRASNLGAFRGKSWGWTHHEVVVREGRVFDLSTGHQGLPIDEYKALWEYADNINFGF